MTTPEQITEIVIRYHMAICELQKHGFAVLEEITEHPRYNEKVEVLAGLLLTLERLAGEMEELAGMHRLHPSSLIAQLSTRHVPRVADPSASGKEGQ